MPSNFHPELSFAQLAEIAIEKTGGDNRAAAKMLVEFATENEEFAERNWESFVRRRVQDALTHKNKDTRKAIAGNAESILDYPLWGGQLLGNVSLKDIGESGQRFLKDAETRSRKARFLLAVFQEGVKAGCDPTGMGGARKINPADLERIFAQVFADGWVQCELPEMAA